MARPSIAIMAERDTCMTLPARVRELVYDVDSSDVESYIMRPHICGADEVPAAPTDVMSNIITAHISRRDQPSVGKNRSLIASQMPRLESDGKFPYTLSLLVNHDVRKSIESSFSTNFFKF